MIDGKIHDEWTSFNAMSAYMQSCVACSGFWSARSSSQFSPCGNLAAGSNARDCGGEVRRAIRPEWYRRSWATIRYPHG